MQEPKTMVDFRNTLERLKTIRSCAHAPEVEVRYMGATTFRFQMCRDCWSEEKYHKISKDTVQIIRPNQVDVEYAKCLGCEIGMDSCGCGAA